MYDEYDERKSLRSDDYDERSAYTSHRDIRRPSGYTESYAPSRNMFQDAEKKGLLSGKEPLAGEIQDGETTEVIKESALRKRWVMLCWMLTFWCPTPFLRWFGRMKRPDVQQAWREKLAINMLIWFVSGCPVGWAGHGSTPGSALYAGQEQVLVRALMVTRTHHTSPPMASRPETVATTTRSVSRTNSYPSSRTPSQYTTSAGQCPVRWAGHGPTPTNAPWTCDAASSDHVLVRVWKTHVSL